MKSEKTITNIDFSEYEKIINYRSELYITEYIIPLYGNNVSGNELLNIIQKQFNAMLLYIRKYIPKIDYSNIELLDYIFSLYVELCIKYNRNPTIQGYSFLSGINQLTIYKWENGYSRVNQDRINLIKRWHSICKDFLIDDLSNSDKASINKIFIAKSVFGLNDSINVNSNDSLVEIQAETLPTLSIDCKE